MIAIKQTYLFNFLPVVLIIVAALFFALDKVLLFSVFCVPFSVGLSDFFPDIGFNVDLPTEPIFVSILFIFLLKFLLERNYDKRILKHHFSIMVFIYLAWRLVTVFTSQLPLVSAKYFLASLWFVIPFFFFLILLFKEPKNINKFFFLYILALAVVIIITLIKHSSRGFSQQTANYIVSPFYNDHTSYGAAIAMYIPVIVGFIFNKNLKRSLRILSMVLLAIFVAGMIFSYTRAAWVSLVGAFVMFLILKFKINYKVIIAAVVLFLAVFAGFQDQIFYKMGKNKQDSSTNFSEHVKSITNVATDASNLERINRWNCAVRMFKEKPVFGWGPGTYQFKYAPFQHSDEKTIISTNAGNGGNAHSEYLGSLAESGLFGMINYVLICLVIFVVGSKTYAKLKDENYKVIVASALCGLVTYFIHGLLNNFLDIDKIAVPFWGFAAAIVAIDIYFTDKQTQELQNPLPKE